MSVSPLVWVVGAGGLLGSSVWRELEPDAFRPEQALTWSDGARLEQDLSAAIEAFGRRLAAEPGRPWAIAWCAGAGVVATSAQALEAETASFQRFLQLVESAPALRTRAGSIALASSAGGVYGGCFVSRIGEATPPAPISPYGRAKLEQERLLARFCERQPDINALIARFSNLYGPAQRLQKAQGLISHASRCLIHSAPLQIYVSMDTIRDYLFVDDAARSLVRALFRLSRERAPLVTKVFASESEISISGLLGVFRQISRRRLRVVAGLHPLAHLQPRRLQFRSQIWTEDASRKVELVEGVSRVYHRQLAEFALGKLPAPALRSSR